jgi:hypothetical protein
MKWFLFGIATAVILGFASENPERSRVTSRILDPAIHKRTGRDPEDRGSNDPAKISEKMWDKTLADSYPCSDPPSTIPNPSEEDSLAS